MSYRVRTESFEGPFDLLLYLVSRQRVDIGAISVNEIVNQYLDEIAKMDGLDLDVASDFLLVASTLLEIKAQSLVPAERDDTDEEVAELTPSEARDMLIAKLIDYKKYKNAANMLASRAEAQARMHARTFGAPERFSAAMPNFLRGVSLDSLGFLAAGAFSRRDVVLLESDHIAKKPIPVEVHVRALHKRLEVCKHLRFSELVDDTTPTPVVVVSFLALLELYKRQMVNLSQDEVFGDIVIDYIEGSGELDLTGDDALTSASAED